MKRFLSGNLDDEIHLKNLRLQTTALKLIKLHKGESKYYPTLETLKNSSIFCIFVIGVDLLRVF